VPLLKLSWILLKVFVAGIIFSWIGEILCPGFGSAGQNDCRDLGDRSGCRQTFNRGADCPVFGIVILSNAYADMVLFSTDRLPAAMKFGIIHLPIYTLLFPIIREKCLKVPCVFWRPYGFLGWRKRPAFPWGFWAVCFWEIWMPGGTGASGKAMRDGNQIRLTWGICVAKICR
jgi:hypothetical protein